MTDTEKADARARIAEIDSWFADATGWGSWMVEMSNERRALVDRLRAAGLRGADLRLHDFRHTAATRMLRATGNLAMAQRQLGHARIETTSRYAHVLDDDLRDGLNAANPVGPVAKKMRDRG